VGDNFSDSGAGSGRSTRSADKAMNVPRTSRSSDTSSAPLYRSQIDDEQSMTSTSTAARRKTSKSGSSRKRDDTDDDFSPESVQPRGTA
jgi:hypothetical protein